MLRIVTATALLALLIGPLPGQDPTPAPRQEEPKQEPVNEPKPQEPKPQEPKPQEPKPQEPKPDTPQKPESGTDKPAGDEKDLPKAEDPPKVEETEVDLPDDVPLPAGADPADLRAMKSAQDMLMAERRMREAIKAGTIKDVDKLLSFEEISSWPYRDGLRGMPEAVRDLDGKEVVMIGFMLPIDEVEDIQEFLLVQSLWACCFGTPPDIHGIVRVVMKGEKRVDYQFDPVQVRGTFEVEETTEDGYVIDIYQLHASSVSLVR